MARFEIGDPVQLTASIYQDGPSHIGFVMEVREDGGSDQANQYVVKFNNDWTEVLNDFQLAGLTPPSKLLNVPGNNPTSAS